VPAGKLKKKYDKKILFYILKSLKKGVGSGSISQRYGSRDPDPRQNVKDPQHCLAVFGITRLKILKSSPLLQRCYRAKARRDRPQQLSPRSCTSFPAPHSSCPASCPAHGARAREEVPLVRIGSHRSSIVEGNIANCSILLTWTRGVLFRGPQVEVLLTRTVRLVLWKAIRLSVRVLRVLYISRLAYHLC
jgi:hypothetical protein